MTADPGFDLGPQYSGDTDFAARMRFHQSWYRARILRLPYGIGPTMKSGRPRGNMLASEDARRGLNFLTPGIFRVVRERIAENVGVAESFRLLHNMLSSQPMCFNLFGPLRLDTALATRLVNELIPGEVIAVNAVRLEYAPEPQSEFLNDNTAFDAFIDYTCPDGSRAFIGVETKLVEPFSQRRYPLASPRHNYAHWTKRTGSPWPEEAWPYVDAVAHNQLWRDQLLAEALRAHPASPYTKGRLLLIHHPLDTNCAAIANGYRSLLKPGDDTLLIRDLDQVVSAWETAAEGASDQSWLSGLRLRYLDFDASEEEWRQRA